MSMLLAQAPAVASWLMVLGLAPGARGPLPSPAALARARGQPIVRELQHAVAGLVYQTEADFPLRVLAWPSPHGPPTAEQVGRFAGWPPGAPVVERTVADFFATAATPQAWHTPAERTAARRFQALVSLLQTRLRETRVFLRGTIEIEAYVVGVTPGGDWAGVATRLVQT